MKPAAPFADSLGHGSPPGATARPLPADPCPAAGPDNPFRDPAADGPIPDKGGRDHRGRFAPGNKGGPGNPYARRTALLRQAMLDAVTPEDIQAIVRQLIQKAREGDVAAARLVLAYAIGKPDKATDPDAVEVHEFHLWQQSAVANQDLASAMGRIQAGLANELLRNAVPSVQEATADQFGQAMRDSLPGAGQVRETPPGDVLPGIGPTDKPQPETETPTAPASDQPAKQARDGRRTKREGRRNPAAAFSENAGPPFGRSCSGREDEEVVEDALLEEMFRKYEREVRLGLLQEIGGLVVDQRILERTDDQAAPSPNGFFRTPPPG